VLGSWGGRRWAKFSDDEDALAEFLLWVLIKSNPMRCRPELVNLLAAEGVIVSESWITRKLQKWKWSFKVASYRQIQKFTMENITYYGVYLTNICRIPFLKLKFLDESRFVSRRLQRRRGIAPIGQRLRVVNGQPLVESYSLIIMTTLSGHTPIAFSEPTSATTNGIDFLTFVLYLLENGQYLPSKE